MQERNRFCRVILKPIILWCSTALLGRRNLYRLSRFLINGARGDVLNDFANNGERMVQRVALSLASSAVVFDVGANVGDWTACLLALESAVNVHAFEPCKETYETLAGHIEERGWKNVTAVQCACSRELGVATMSIYGSGAGTNTLSPLDELLAAQLQEVQVTTIDEYCRKNRIAFVDFLKIDAEGHDFEVICGARRMLERHSVRILQFEYNHRWIGSRNFLRDVFAMLNPMGYCIGKITGPAVEFYPHWHWELETFREGNYVACTGESVSHFPRQAPSWLFPGATGGA